MQVVNATETPPGSGVFVLDAAERFNYTLIALPFKVIYDSTDLPTPLEDPRQRAQREQSLSRQPAVLEMQHPLRPLRHLHIVGH